MKSTNANTRRQIPENSAGLNSSPAATSVTQAQLFTFLLAATAFLYLRAFLLPSTPLPTAGDELHYFLHAVRMTHGQVPFRDFFTFILPGTDWLYAGAFHLVGVRAWVVQGFTVFLGFSLLCVITWIAGYILRGPLLFLPGLLFLVFDFNGAMDATHHWWSTLFVILAAGVMLKRISNRRILIAGALCGIATLFTQTQGTFGFLAIAVYLLLTVSEKRRSSRLRDLLILALPFTVIVGSMIGYYAYKIGLHTILYWTIYFPIVYFPTIEAHKPGAYFLGAPKIYGLSDLLIAAPYLFVHIIVPLIYLLCAVRLIRENPIRDNLVKEKKTMDPTIWRSVVLLCLVGVALCITVMAAATYLRLCVVAPPAVILCVWYFSGTTRPYRLVRFALWIASVGLILYLPINRQLHSRYYLDLPIGRTAFLEPAQYEKMRWFAQHTHAGETLFDDPMTSFALSLPSPAQIDYATLGEFTRPEQVAELVSALSSHQTEHVFLYRELYENVHGVDNLGPLRQYLTANYQVISAPFPGQVWERK
jgi:hypothetical protein